MLAPDPTLGSRHGSQWEETHADTKCLARRNHVCTGRGCQQTWHVTKTTALSSERVPLAHLPPSNTLTAVLGYFVFSDSICLVPTRPGSVDDTPSHLSEVV